MFVNQPLQQRIGFDPDGDIGAGRSATQVRGSIEHLVTHLPPVTNGNANIREYLGDLVFEYAQVLSIRLAIDSDTHKRLRHTVFFARLGDACDSSTSVPLYRQDGMNGHVNGQLLSIDLCVLAVDCV